VDLKAYSELDSVDIVHLISEGALSPLEFREQAFGALEAIEYSGAIAEIYRDDDPNSAHGLLSGVPLLHKDGGAQIEGKPREYGSPLAKGQVCSYTSQFFRSLISQGCEIVGRSRVPELHMSILADNAILGSTVHPWDPTRSMGGSTGGVTAVALGATPAAHGGDSGGSLRVPASWAGCYTLKPTRGTVSASPGGTELFGLNEIFVVTRSLRDLRLFISVVSTPAPDDLVTPVTRRDHWAWGSRRVGICKSFYPGLQVHGDIAKTVDEFARSAERIGFDVSECSFSLDFDKACDALYVLGSLDLQIMVDSLSDDGYSAVKKLCQPYIARWYADSLALSHNEIMTAFDTISNISRSFTRLLGQYDFLVTPVTALPPPRLDTLHQVGTSYGSRELNRRFEEIVHFCAAPNMSGHPALVMPYGYVTGTAETRWPCGVQIIGRADDDLGLIEFGELFDRGFAKPPGHLSLLS
jgi:amidase